MFHQVKELQFNLASFPEVTLIEEKAADEKLSEVATSAINLEAAQTEA